MATQATFCGNIVVKLQNTNAYAEPCRISYTVCGSPPVILLKFNDYIIHNFRQPETQFNERSEVKGKKHNENKYFCTYYGT